MLTSERSALWLLAGPCEGESCLPRPQARCATRPSLREPPGVCVPAPEAVLGGAPTVGSPQALHTGSEDSNTFVLLLPPIRTRLKTPLNFCQGLKNVTIRY